MVQQSLNGWYVSSVHTKYHQHFDYAPTSTAANDICVAGLCWMMLVPDSICIEL